MIHTCTKEYKDLPASHRAPKHDGHCRLVHGHNWGFTIVFAADTRDENGFVIDVGKLKLVKSVLEAHFDHTLLLNENDKDFPADAIEDFANIVRVPDCSMEGLAEWVFVEVAAFIQLGELPGRERGLRVVSVTCSEDSKNSATYG